MIGQPPQTTSPELAEYLVRTLREVENRRYRAPEAVVPAKPQNGKIYYFNKIINPEITVAGFWGYHNGWIQL